MLDFCELTTIIRANYKENELPGQTKFARDLFKSYLDSEDIDAQYFEATQICRWLKGVIKVSPVLTKYYLESNKHQYAMTEDIAKNIVPHIFDMGMLVNEINDAILNDNALSDRKKKEILPDVEVETVDDLADYLTYMVLFTLQRPFVKRDIQKNRHLITGAASPIIADRIYMDDVPKLCPYFIGRDGELKELEKIVSNYSKVAVTGVAGIGKSELVKAFLQKNRKNFTNILYINYSGNLYEDIADLDFADDVPEDDTHTRFSKHNRFLRSLKEDSLIVIDGFNTTADKERVYSVVKKYRSNVLFTTRGKLKGISHMELKEIEKDEDIFEIAKFFYKRAEEDREVLNEMIAILHRHTFAVELAARLLKNGILTPEELVVKLKEESINLSSSDEIDIDKDGEYVKDTYYGHIRTLFSLYTLNDESMDVMRCMCFVPISGISKKLYARWMGHENLNLINYLIDSGFITEKNDYDIYLHPMVGEITKVDAHPSVTKCEDFLKRFIGMFIYHGADFPYYQKLLTVTENIIAIIDVDDTAIYIRFLEDAFTYMQDYKWTSGQGTIIEELESIVGDGTDGTDSDRAQLYDSKACMAIENGKFEEALELGRIALSYVEKDPNADELLLANISANVAEEYMNIGDYDNAEEHILKAIDHFDKTDGTRMNDKFAMGAIYAMVLQGKGDRNRGLEILEGLKKELEDGMGYRGKDYAYLETQTAAFYINEMDIENARKCLQNAHDIYAEVFAGDEELLAIKDQELQYIYSSYLAPFGIAASNMLDFKE